jgi:tRNA A37 methylthiotransferase MiaB
MDMRRGYTVDDFLRIVQCFREEIPNMTLWTDIICGYPTEDEEAFIDSLKVIDEVEPDTVNISKFSPRPMTQASRLKLLPSYVVKDRSRRMAKLCARISLERNLLWVNWVGRVLIDETGGMRPISR